MESGVSWVSMIEKESLLLYDQAFPTWYSFKKKKTNHWNFALRLNSTLVSSDLAIHPVLPFLN